MSLYETMDEFRIKINQLVEQIEEVSSSSQTLPSTDFDQLGHKFAGLMKNLEEAHGQMRMATELLEEMINTLKTGLLNNQKRERKPLIIYLDND